MDLFDSVQDEGDGPVSGGPYTESIVQPFPIGKLNILIPNQPTYIHTYIHTHSERGLLSSIEIVISILLYTRAKHNLGDFNGNVTIADQLCTSLCMYVCMYICVCKYLCAYRSIHIVRMYQSMYIYVYE